jgi:hypothetical protein
MAYLTEASRDSLSLARAIVAKVVIESSVQEAIAATGSLAIDSIIDAKTPIRIIARYICILSVASKGIVITPIKAPIRIAIDMGYAMLSILTRKPEIDPELMPGCGGLMRRITRAITIAEMAIYLDFLAPTPRSSARGIDREKLARIGKRRNS